MELKQLSEEIYYIPNSANIGVIVKNSDAIVIDTGIDDDTGKKIMRIIEASGMRIRAIINTHSHADHIGGNSYIKAKTGAKIYAPEKEAAFVNYPYFEPFFLFSGANPIKDLQNKFSMAKPSQVDYTNCSEKRELEVCGITLGILPLPGHALNQIGIFYKDILFCADALFSVDILNKHKIPFCTDISSQKETLNLLRESRFSIYVPSHGVPSDNPGLLADEYLTIIERLENYILDIASQAKSSEEILSLLCAKLDITIKSPLQYYLLNTSMMAYLSSLHKEGRLKVILHNNRLCWIST